ncbi:hypothetical protein BD779DRAFT_1584341 [Infundibulicybe gibba]|nr:hypothetical protein BD779DRAFT_1584341 [Infundibulicybe gibba]
MRTGNPRQPKQDSAGQLCQNQPTYVIWKIRCERVIQRNNTPMTKTEVKNRWLHAINTRPDLDKRMTDKKYERKALAKLKLVRKPLLSRDWTGSSRVLVGIILQQDDRRGRDR